MNCPVCSVELRLADKQGVEIDYCPKCRGVWLDRGELEKIIARASTWHEDDDEESRRSYGPRPSEVSRQYPAAGHKREGFLSRLFDFD